MQYLWESVIITAMFVARLGVPLAIMLLVSHLLLRLDARWRAEALAHQQPLAGGTACTGPDEAAMAQEGMAQGGVALIQEPCWEYRACSEATRSRCPAYLTPQVPCWLAQRMARGTLPSQCGACSIFTTARRIGMRTAA